MKLIELLEVHHPCNMNEHIIIYDAVNQKELETLSKHQETSYPYWEVVEFRKIGNFDIIVEVIPEGDYTNDEYMTIKKNVYQHLISITNVVRNRNRALERDISELDKVAKEWKERLIKAPKLNRKEKKVLKQIMTDQERLINVCFKDKEIIKSIRRKLK